MALQTSNLVMVGLGTANDAPPNSEQPPLIDGIHLRWAFKRELGFPWHGFYLFRRAHDPGTPSWLSQHTSNLPPGAWSSNSLDTPLGRVVSDKNLVLTENFPPPASVEFDLDNRKFLAFVFPDAQPARRVETRVGFRSRPGDPPPTKSTISFLGRSPGAESNPLKENGVEFEAREKDDKNLRPNNFIRSVQTSSGTITGLACKFKLHITLPQVASFVEVTLTGAGRRNDPAGSPTIEIFDANGTRLEMAAMRDPSSRVPETFLLAGAGIKQIVIDERLSEVTQDDTQERLILNDFTWGTGTVSEIVLTAYASTTPVQQKRIRGYAGRIVSEQLEFEGISVIDITSAPAALIDLGAVPLSQGTTNGWTRLSGVPYPLRLPITHPDYPCTPQAPENFATSRDLARDRIRYGSPDQFTSTPVPVASAGTISVTNGSPIVVGANTNWTNALVDTVVQVGADPTIYTIVMVVSPTKLVLSRNYSGASRSGSAYQISRDKYGQFYNYLINLVAGGKNAGLMVDRALPAPVVAAGTVAVAQDSAIVVGTGTSWTTNLVGLDFQLNGDDTVYAIASVESATRLTLERAYPNQSATGSAYSIGARLQASAAGAIAPRMPAQSPLDMVLLGSTHPAVAQMSGLYFIDSTPDPALSYDYLIVADYNGVAQLNPDTMLTIIQQSGFSTVEGSIVYNLKEIQAPALARPGQLEVYALPGSSRHTESGNAEEAVNNVGLRWDLTKTPFGVLLPGKSVMYHLWRANRGNDATPGASAQYNLLTKNWPIFVVDSNNAQSAPDWPPFPLHALDNALADGWYSYQVSGIDIFGRHTPNSLAGVWRQWSPIPEPRPWYYQEPPSDAVIHSSAIRLLTKIAPPPPTGVEAFALDPSDPTVLKDAAYNNWWSKLTDAQKKMIGLRVRWQWPQSHMDQAPHTREFRIYYQPGNLNAVLGNTQTVVAAGAAESDVTTDIPNAASANSYVGAALYAGADAFVIVGSEEGSPLRVRVRNVGPRDNVAPEPNMPCTIAIPPAYASGRSSVANGSKVVTGDSTEWTDAFKGTLFKIATDERSYRIASVASATQLVLEEPYEGATKGDRIYSIQHPLFVEYTAPVSWQRRYYVVPQDQNWSAGTDASGQPVRNYEIFLPVPLDAGQSGLPLAPSLTEPIVYAHIGISAADDKPHTPDDPKWTGQWSGRPGNEGRVGAPVKVFRVLREAPPAPQLPRLPERFSATRADQNGASFYTFRWQPLARTATHVFRAFDDALFRVDWSQRPRPALDATKLELFPSETVDPRWTSVKRQQVATELNQLNSFAHDAAGTEQAFTYYRGLSSDALRVLAGLPGNDAAFTQITTAPLYPEDPANNNRRGPDDPDGFIIGDPSNPLASPSLRASVDALEGFIPNRNFYRAAYVDAAHNRSGLSLATPPVFVPKTTPPRSPALTKAVAGERQITLFWTPNREGDVVRYIVYRTDDEARAQDVNLMVLVHVQVASAADPAELSWTDTPVDANKSLYYRMVAEDINHNESKPSPIVVARAYDTSRPLPPHAGAIWNGAAHTVSVTWSTEALPDDLEVSLQRADAEDDLWLRIKGWTPAAAGEIDDVRVLGGSTYQYKLRARNKAGRLSDNEPVIGPISIPENI